VRCTPKPRYSRQEGSGALRSLALRKTLESIASKLRDETDLEAVRDDLAGMVRDDAALPRHLVAAPQHTFKGRTTLAAVFS